uniref:Uncharacterized protein n=1 Tax=Hyaloperonospora arabidopsidis (strain Emoy2) TaxID=559515 RepID=M4B7X4_HYAAE
MSCHQNQSRTIQVNREAQTVYYIYLSLIRCLVVWLPPRVIYHDTVLLLLAFSFCWLKTSGVTARHSQKGP